MTLKEIVEQLESCSFECEAGSLESNIAFIELKKAAEKDAQSGALTLHESTRDNPSKFKCSCGETELQGALHHDYLEFNCFCGREYRIKVNEGLWNCCVPSVNPPIETV
jgi:hypothetical protein